MLNNNFQDTVLKEDLNTCFLAAKISADPYNYRISNCLYSATPLCKYTVSHKQSNTEAKLSSCLKLNHREDYLAVSDKLGECAKFLNTLDYTTSTAPSNIAAAISIAEAQGNNGYFINYNNVMMCDNSLLNDLSILYETMYKKTYTPFEIMTATSRPGSYLESLVCLHLKLSAKDSLIPNLFYLVTNMEHNSLYDLENLIFTKKDIEANLESYIHYKGEQSITCIYTMYMQKICNAKQFPHYIKDGSVPWRDYIGTPEESALQKLSIVYNLIYGFEILYQVSTITNLKYVENIKRCLALNTVSDSLISKWLYTVEGTLEEPIITINPTLELLFNKNPEVRFNLFKDYLNTILSKDPQIAGFTFNENDTYFYPGLIFGRLVADCHQHAIQTIRIKHLVLLYNIAKTKGVLKASDFKKIASSMKSTGMVPPGTDIEDPELLNLDLDEYEDDDDDEYEDDDDTKEDADDVMTTKTEKRAPTLDVVSRLKDDLTGSEYRYSVSNVESHSQPSKEAYGNAASKINMLVRILARQIKEIKTYNSGGKNPGKSVGKIDRKNLYTYRTNHNIFYNNTYKTKEMDLAFGIILDMSGSMSGTNIANGRISMILLHEVLTSIGVNHSIIGHDSNGHHQCNIYKYYYFNEEKEHTIALPYALAEIRSLSGNCDSGALYYMESLFKRVHNKDKICIIFSDGEPTECSDSELRDQIKHMEHNGIHVIGIGINFDSIKDYYNDYANGHNLKEMVDIIVSILKRYILEKVN